MNINWAAPTIDIFNLDYPPMNNVFRQPSEPFSLDSSHALTPIILGCYSAYGMHVCDAPKPGGPLTTRQPAEYKWMSGYPTPLQKIG